MSYNFQNLPYRSVHVDAQNELIDFACKDLIYHAQQSIQAKGQFTLGLSGGSSPLKIFSRLFKKEIASQINWDLVHCFWVDERCVKHESPLSNFGNAMRAGLSKWAVNLYPFYDEVSIQSSCERYKNQLKITLKSPENGLDYCILGMGQDGHCASLFPQANSSSWHDPSSEQEWCDHYLSPNPPRERLSLTLKQINKSQRTLFYIFGKDKALMLSKLFKLQDKAQIKPTSSLGPYPAAYVKCHSSTPLWLCDTESAIELTKASIC